MSKLMKYKPERRQNTQRRKRRTACRYRITFKRPKQFRLYHVINFFVNGNVCKFYEEIYVSRYIILACILYSFVLYCRGGHFEIFGKKSPPYHFIMTPLHFMKIFQKSLKKCQNLSLLNCVGGVGAWVLKKKIAWVKEFFAPDLPFVIVLLWPVNYHWIFYRIVSGHWFF